MKKIKLVFISSLLVLCSALFLTACGGDEKKTPTITPDIDDDVIYFTNQTLDDVVISLGENDTKGVISWEDSTLKIQKGEHEYNYTFAPESESYKEVTGSVKIKGYELIDVTELTIEDQTVDYKTGGVSSLVETKLKNRYFTSKNVSVNIDGEYSATGSYNVNFAVTTLDEYIVFKNGEDYLDSVNFSFNLTIKRNLPQIAYIPELSYTGNFVEPIIVFSDGSNLIKGHDYSVKYQYKGLGASNYEEIYMPLLPGDYIVKITGIANYKGEASVAFKVVADSLPELSLSNATFDGSSKVPTIELPQLTEGVHYSVSWEYKPFGATEYIALDTQVNNFVNAGMYRVTVSGLGSFAGLSLTEDYQVDMAELPNIANVSSVNFNGLSQTPNIQVGSLNSSDYSIHWEYKSTTDSEFSEYTLDADATKNFVNAGEYRATITGVNNYTGEKTVSFTINKIDRTGISVTKTNDNYGSLTFPSVNDYVGEGVTFYYNSENSTVGATELTDETILNVGTYYVYAVISADNNYNAFTTPAVEFVVSQISLPASSLEDKTFNGNSQLPVIDIGGLVKDTDYSLGAWQYRANESDEWSNLDTTANNFVNAGFYKLVVNGMGNYSGSYDLSFEISANEFEVNLDSIVNVDYDADTHKPVVDISPLTENVDYTISYYRKNSTDDFEIIDSSDDNFKNAGEYKVVISGIGNYSGEHFKIFQINKIDRTGISVTQSSAEYGFKVNELTLTGYTGGGVTYYYNTLNSTEGASLFTEETVLDIGTYYIYAVITADTNYNEFTSELVEFKVKKATSVNVDSATEFVRALKNANEINLTGNIGEGSEGEEISINAFDGYNIDTTINMKGYNINSRLSIRNYDVNSKTPYNNSIKLTINGTEGVYETIGSDKAFAGIVVIGDGNVEVILKNLSVKGKTYGFSSNGLCDGATLTATNCEFSAYDSADSCGAYLPAGYTYNFTNCVFNGANGVYIKDGTLTLTDCTLTGVGEYKEISTVPDNYNITGDALTIESNSIYTSGITVTFEGENNFKSVNAYCIREGSTNGECCATVDVNGANDDAIVNFDPDSANEYYSESGILDFGMGM